MNPSIAIVGLACVYPDARTPAELWENALAQRRAFRRLPPERLRTEDYCSPDATAPDRTYSAEAALIANYEFDRVAFRVVGSTYRSADLAHWLALEVASRSLADAGFADGRGLPRETTGVLLGNTLTGEFSRAGLMRLRWPYVRRVIEAALTRETWEPEARNAFLERLEADYKAPFPAVGEESLAGGLSNTIAGRICNQFDLKGGGYTVDGACASSLLAVANACSALTAGDLDVALAGGVDLSLDPFELVGFAKTGALASEEMRVYDRRSAGFWPGEGCGFVTLMRHQDALAQGCRVYAVLRGWGISSDGNGGITRPEAEGQLEAVRRAYRRAGFGIDSVSYFEGHGTGTAVGDATELEVLSQARREAKSDGQPAALGSIKANIGHTKAAAGIAGLLKAVMAVHTQVVPPATGVGQPHEKVAGSASLLRLPREAERWPNDRPLRAAVSAMGFGGINVHVVLESVVAERRSELSSRERQLSRSSQDAELFLLSAASAAELSAIAEKLLKLVPGLSRAELTDLAAQLQKGLRPAELRAAVVASTPAELTQRLETLISWLSSDEAPRFQATEGVFLGSGKTAPRLGFLFPGQGSPTHLDGGIWRRRFDSVRQLYERAALPAHGDTVSTQVMQPAVVTASLAGLKVLEELGVEATAAVGHSLGELTALHWAGMITEETLLRIARVRGAAMAELGSPTGGMLAIAAPWEAVREMLNHDPVTIVGFNSPRQTVVAGDTAALSKLAQRARARGWHASPLPVSHAFHTPLVAAAVPVLQEQLARENFGRLERRVFSTITGAPLGEEEDTRALLCRQVTSPVRFASAFGAMLGVKHESQSVAAGPTDSHAAVDLLIEVGPGAVLSGLAQDTTQIPVMAVDAGGHSLTGLLRALGAAFALGAPVRTSALFEDRFTRPFSLDTKPKFFANPCELAPVPEETVPKALTRHLQVHEPGSERTAALSQVTTLETQPLELIRKLVADRAELPVAAVQDGNRMLSDLHLNSITVGQLVSEAARRLALPRIVGLTDFANASVAEIARALEELKRSGGQTKRDDAHRQPPGVDVWFETFAVELAAAPKPTRPSQPGAHPLTPVPSELGWQVFAPQNHPLAKDLWHKLNAQGGAGVVVWLPEAPTVDHLELLLNGARAAMALKEEPRFVLVQHGWGGAAFARTLHLETPGLSTCILDVPVGQPEAVDWIVAEARSAAGFFEAHYDVNGVRREPRLKWTPRGSREAFEAAASTRSSAPAAGSEAGGTAGKWPIGSEDILLVSGGGKGIGAECALALGRATGARLALIGRAEPEQDKELKENLARIAGVGVASCYARADVTDAQAVCAAVAEVEKKLGGRVTAVMHAAGANAPQLIGALDLASFRNTVAPKVQGARNLLAAVEPERLRLFITFGSIISRVGLPGEADYGTANEWLRAFTEDFQTRHPQCRCLALEWSVWSSIGMGERLGRMESLIQHGIMPIPPEVGVRILLELVQNRALPTAVVVGGRFGEPPTLKFDQPELPLRRFLERRRVYYPGVELVVDAELSLAADPYLEDHVFQKQKLFPAVLGLEAMAQAAMALAESESPPAFERVELTRPVAVLDHRSTTIRLASLRRAPDLIEVCLRSEETDFQVDHFRAFCRFGVAADRSAERFSPARLPAHPPVVDSTQDLYGRILFHRGRFCRLTGYRLATARECIAEIKPDTGVSWFGPYLPSGLVLGDPGARDAALHAIQACIPHRRILPTGIDHLVILRGETGLRIARSKERFRDGNDFVYDVEITDADGELIEYWQGLRLRAVEEMASSQAWPQWLLTPYLERRLEELAPHSPVRVVIEHNGARTIGASDFLEARSAATNSTLQQALRHAGPIWRRPDGKPVTASDEFCSAAHAQDLTLAVAAEQGVACDLELIESRAASVWQDLLGKEKLQLAERISGEQAESLDTAATRLWSVTECLRKTGLATQAPLVLASSGTDCWVLFRSGRLVIATGALPVRGLVAPLIVSIAVHSAAAASSLAVCAEAVA